MITFCIHLIHSPEVVLQLWETLQNFSETHRVYGKMVMKENDVGQKLDLQRKTIREGINEGKVKPLIFVILN